MESRKLRGLLALDIDGTLTAVKEHLPQAVSDYLAHLYHEGWALVFITGRTFHWSMHLLHGLSFPYALAIHNGALLLECGEKKIWYRSSLSVADVRHIEEILVRHHLSATVYAGLDNDEAIYYVPTQLTKEQLEYMQKRRAAIHEKWIAIASMNELPDCQFLAVRCAVETKEAAAIAAAITQELGFPCPRMVDSYDNSRSVIQVTQKGVTKGSVIQHALQALQLPKGVRLPVIACGDDHNDIAMLEVADIKVAMATAPEELLKIADIIAPSAAECGIITGLQLAIERVVS